MHGTIAKDTPERGAAEPAARSFAIPERVENVLIGTVAVATFLLANNKEERHVVGVNFLVCKKIVGSDDLCGNAAFGVDRSTAVDDTIFAFILPEGWHLVIVLAEWTCRT